MFDVGMFELLLIMIMGLVVLGPERLPEAARLIGAWMSKTKRTMADIKTGVEREVNAHEMRERIKAELEKAGLDDIKEKFEQQEAQFRRQLQQGERTDAPQNDRTSQQPAASQGATASPDSQTEATHPAKHVTPQRDFDDEAHHDCSDPDFDDHDCGDHDALETEVETKSRKSSATDTAPTTTQGTPPSSRGAS